MATINALTSSVPFADPPWHQTGSNSPYYNESHKRLQREVREYVDEFVLPYAEDWEREGSVPEEVRPLNSRSTERGVQLTIIVRRN